MDEETSQNKEEEQETQSQVSNEEKKKSFSFKPDLSGLKGLYEAQYKKLLIIPFTLLLIAILLIGFKVATTGDFINRDVSLKGGVTVTLPTNQEIDILQLENSLSSKFPANDLSIKSLSQLGKQVGVIVEADIGEENREEQIERLINEISNSLNRELTANDYSIEIVGSSLGASFFKEIIIALLIAFVLMVLVVFIYFRTLIPSAAVILAVFSDILITVAIVNLLGMKLSTAGIAAFLMLIGYSVDTNILLSTRVLKRKEGTENERFYGAFRTGITMSLTTLTVAISALIFTQSEVIKQIMIILLIGLLTDLINTWIQNVGILRIYLERKAKKLMEQ
jgi:preprotein translocase subunit SecF|tara:strand:+ start:3847 stop:4857 length:1011 start_codon:yes stop_codon:yes gene_type:complete